MRTLVSGPLTCVVWYALMSPERTSRHTGALLSGCVRCRCTSAGWPCAAPGCCAAPCWAGTACCCAGAGCWAHAAGTTRIESATRSRAHHCARIICMFLPLGLLRADAQILVLGVVASLDRFFPLGLVVVERLALPRQIVGLALVLALFVYGHVRFLAATG